MLANKIQEKEECHNEDALSVMIAAEAKAEARFEQAMTEHAEAWIFVEENTY